MNLEVGELVKLDVLDALHKRSWQIIFAYHFNQGRIRVGVGNNRQARLPLAAVRERTAASLAQLPEPLRQLETAPAFGVQVAACVRRLAEEVDAYEVAQSRGQ